MISKSKSRSYQGGFRQLLKNYFGNKAYLEKFTWNMYSNRFNDEELLKEFNANAKYIKNSRGKNYLYHEIIALPYNELSERRIIDILQDLASKYLELRAKNHLAFGIVHNDTKHPHIHLVISSNEINGNKRVRLSKKELAQIQNTLEQYKNTYYKELEQTHHYEQAKQKTKQSKKEQVKESLEDIFLKAQSKIALENTLKAKGFEISVRGSNTRLIYKKKPYRLKTLGLDEIYNKTLSRLEKVEARKERRNEFKNSKKRTNSFNLEL